MRHLRSDYDAIQPWPVKRPHIVKIDGETVDTGPDSPDHVRTLGRRMEPLIPDDEPVFLLRGQDPAAAAAVATYAGIAQALGADPTFVAQVRAWAVQMLDYADAKQHGAPDVPPGMLRDANA